MTTFTVHEKATARPDDVILVPEGFSIGAFLFTVIWAFWKRLWVVGLVVLAVFVAMALLPQRLGLDAAVAGIVQLALSLLFGFEANNLWRLSLSRAGYREVALVSGDSLFDAELRYFASRTSPEPSASAASAQPVPARYAHDTLGLFGNV